MAQDEIEKALQEAEETLKRIEAKTEKMRYDSQRDVLKHFDRIHDHLFLLNTVFITGYIALLQIGTHFNRFILILPFICLAILIYVEHYMKESARKYKYGQTNEKYKESSRKSSTADRKPTTYSRASNFGSQNEM